MRPSVNLCSLPFMTFCHMCGLITKLFSECRVRSVEFRRNLMRSNSVQWPQTVKFLPSGVGRCLSLKT